MKQLRADIGFSKEIAQYVSRFILSTEIFIAIAILQANFLKRIILPLSTLLLIGFSIHLFIGVTQGKTGNCGCFGELIPMTPIQALLKNILTILVLYFIYIHTSINKKSKLSSVSIIFLLSLLFMFIIAPLRSLEKSTILYEQKTSIYSKYIPGVDEGEYIVCFFAPGCDHCQEAAKEIAILQEELSDFPNVYVCFMDEEPEKIPDFFKIAGSKFNYKILDFESFFDVFYAEHNTPGIVYLNDGDIIKFYQGTEEGNSENVFDVNDLKSVLEK